MSGFQNIDIMAFADLTSQDIQGQVKAKIKDLQGQVVKLKTDKDVKEITIKHLRTELETKS
jgi:hypothetical protein